MDSRVLIDETGARRMKDTEFVLPVIVGTCAFYLGKKATEYASHRWTVYLRGLNNEDLSHIISRVQFDLHQTFNNPQRVVERQPFEVTENGWGEFEIVVHIHFVPEAGENEVILYHKLKLYEDGEQPGVTKQDPKKPVVTETYEEIVFSEPKVEFYTRLLNHTTMPLNPPSQLQPYFQPVPEAEELEMIRRCRAKIAAMMQEMPPQMAAPAAPIAYGGVIAPPPPPV